MFQNNQIQDFEENDYQYNETRNYPKCNCNNPECNIKNMSYFGLEAIHRSNEFSEYFPDLLLKDVPFDYSVSNIYDIFNDYCVDNCGDNIVFNITIVPGAASNLIVVRFCIDLPQFAYNNLLCMRWSLYKNPGKIETLTAIRNAKICVFDADIWNSLPRYGLEYNFPSYNPFHQMLQNNPQTIHLYNYVNNECEPSHRFTQDIMVMLKAHEKKIENDALWLCSELYPDNNLIESTESDSIEEHLNEDENKDIDWENAIHTNLPLEEKNHDADDDDIYEYCEIQSGIWHRRLRDENEDPDQLHFNINIAITPEERAAAFWG